MKPLQGLAGQTSCGYLVMVLLANVVLLSAAAAVRAVECMCPASYNPVCAENGVTYSNPCTARCAGVWVAHGGRCNSSMTRVRNGDARSSDDLQKDLTEGLVYMRQLHQIFLDGTNTSCACPANFDPVCTCKGVTRSNACTAACFFREDVAYYGECSPYGPPKIRSKPASSSFEPRAGHGLYMLTLMAVVGSVILLGRPFFDILNVI